MTYEPTLFSVNYIINFTKIKKNYKNIVLLMDLIQKTHYSS